MAADPGLATETLSPGRGKEPRGTGPGDVWALTLDNGTAALILSLTLFALSTVVVLAVFRRKHARSICGFSRQSTEKPPQATVGEDTGVPPWDAASALPSTSTPSLESPSPACPGEKASSASSCAASDSAAVEPDPAQASGGMRRSASFISGSQNRSAAALAASFFSSGVGTWILYCPAQLSSLYGMWPVLLYAVAIAVPMWIFMLAGPMVREEMKKHVAFGLTDYVHVRFGRSMQIVTAVVSFFSIMVAMAGELAFVAAAAQTLAPAFPRLAVILSVAVVTFAYTAFAGTNASLVTDKFQSFLLPLLLSIVLVAPCLHSQVSEATWKDAATWTPEGAFSGVLMVLSCCPAYAMDPGMWQRVLSGKGTREVRWGLLGGSLLVLPTIALLGLTGILARATAVALEAQGYTVNEDNLVSAPFFFLVLPSLSRGLVAVVFILAVILTAGSVDTFQSALPSLVAVELNAKRLSFGWGLLVSLVANIPAVLLAFSWTESFIQLMLIGNLLTAAIFPPIFLGLCKRTTALGSVVGSIAGAVSIFFSGLIFTRGDASMAARWIVLPLGMDDPSAVYTFLIVPATAALVTVCVSALQPRKARVCPPP
ncbi:conserved hypothetical protein [Neospora caninum Liverpool]|uniref:Transporter, solute:sodium symporter (SSS) family protein n=1 Tax=Neospora caninum (strain Liverpool) TaxID=572307 RepID=F0VMH2_NEOCL|nr:conserved hypothetical protein [Neospora caninum Liverpool]CBZ54918.1 conserved hypothetical protein [Neospora caninum Liverpool]CEL69640.1 TPA: transporter, solute:sodium symporter (SSS) family protein [Neospora caninum Liverpool]|eukprot:XP_003884946.1 conserved hypothetical protein [Neospora caninum Liverpool]